MKFFDLVDISEKYMELVNPSTPEKAIKLGKHLRLNEGSRIIDFGCGFGEMLALWATNYDIRGVGIDIRPNACERARQKMRYLGLTDRIEIVCMSAADYVYEPGTFDAATCIGATFAFGGFRPAIQTMRRALRPGGRIGLGEPYWQHTNVPADVVAREPSFVREPVLFNMAREEGYDIEYALRANHDDWDRYEADNWHGIVRWLEDNPAHPERNQVLDHMRKTQDDYAVYGREFIGWAMYALAPIV